MAIAIAATRAAVIAWACDLPAAAGLPGSGAACQDEAPRLGQAQLLACRM
jgi:hypothetical protein